MASHHSKFYTRQTLTQDLSAPHRLIFNDPRVFARLQLDRVSDVFVDQCSSALLADRGVRRAREQLLGIARAALEEGGEEEEEEEIWEDDLVDDPEIGLVHGPFVRREGRMHRPLTTLFRYIEHFDADAGTELDEGSDEGAPLARQPKQAFTRTFQPFNKMGFNSDGTTGLGHEMPDRYLTPDFLLLDRDLPTNPSPSPSSQVQHQLQFRPHSTSASEKDIASTSVHAAWLGQAAFCILRTSSSQGPYPSHPSPPASESTPAISQHPSNPTQNPTQTRTQTHTQTQTQTQNPPSDPPTKLPPILIQAAAYARAHLSSRPFQLSSVALLIFGTQFCVAIFDREGVVLSPVREMWGSGVGFGGGWASGAGLGDEGLEDKGLEDKGLEDKGLEDKGLSPVFVRLVRALTREVGVYELGRDPTVCMLPGEEHERWVRYLKENLNMELAQGHLGHEGSEWEYPTFEVDLTCSRQTNNNNNNTNSNYSTRVLLTIGSPLYTSLSLLGRGTSVWLVADKATKELFVLKNGWRKNGLRMSESAVNEAISDKLSASTSALEGEGHPALARFECGGDVLVAGLDGASGPGWYPLTVQNTRLPMTPSGDNTACFKSQLTAHDTVLHRLLLKSYGRPITEWDSYKELLQAVRAAVSAHEFLCSRGILHRDINPGNVMLYASLPGQEPPPAAGFLMDVEYALVDSEELGASDGVHGAEGPRNTAHTGVFTGTAHFLAAEILEALEAGDPPPERKAHHDLESFIYVLAYGLFGGLFLPRPWVNPSNRTLSSKFTKPVPKRTLNVAREYFHETFGAMSYREIFRNQKAVMALEPGVRLREYLSGALSGLLLDLRRKIQMQGDWFAQELLTHEYLLGRLDEAIEGL